jgi:hypothetical protein
MGIMMKVEMTKEIDEQDISDLLCNAFEGGSNYWYTIKEFGNPDNMKCEYRHLELPMSENGYLMIGTNDDGDGDKPACLDRTALAKGLQIMSDKYSVHFQNFIMDNADAETGDVFLQCCLFGDIVYG